MKKYLIFAGYNYYPAGGWDDFKGNTDTYEEALEFCLEDEETKGCDWLQIVLKNTCEIIYTNSK